MSHQINKFTHEQVWEILNSYTFTAGNKSKTENWYPGIIFHADGTFENTEKSVGLHNWKFANDRIEFFDKIGKLSQFGLFSTIKSDKNGFEIRLNFPNQTLENYNLLYSDGLKIEKDVFLDAFSEEGEIVSYQSNNPINFPYFYQSGKIKIDRPAKYLLSFDVRIEDVFSFSDNDVFFKLLMFDEISGMNLVLVDEKQFSINFENITSNKWKHIEKELILESDNVIYGPYLAGNGHAEFKKINLSKVLPSSIRKR